MFLFMHFLSVFFVLKSFVNFQKFIAALREWTTNCSFISRVTSLCQVYVWFPCVLTSHAFSELAHTTHMYSAKGYEHDSAIVTTLYLLYYVLQEIISTINITVQTQTQANLTAVSWLPGQSTPLSVRATGQKWKVSPHGFLLWARSSLSVSSVSAVIQNR